MQYVGSKNRVSKALLPVILGQRRSDQWYIEPFVGGANMIDKVPGRRIGNDSHAYLIAMWRALQRGWTPPTNVTRQAYYWVKQRQNTLPPELVGFVGFLCSFGGKWWGGYAFNSAGNNYAERGGRVLAKQVMSLKDVVFLNLPYWELDPPPNSLIYCDPPYEGTVEYKDKFDHLKFWAWVRGIHKRGHTVFVSEYAAPEDFECVLEIQHKTILDRNSQYPRIERLFKSR